MQLVSCVCFVVNTVLAPRRSGLQWNAPNLHDIRDSKPSFTSCKPICTSKPQHITQSCKLATTRLCLLEQQLPRATLHACDIRNKQQRTPLHAATAVAVLVPAALPATDTSAQLKTLHIATLSGQRCNPHTCHNTAGC
jgi:hypothetical protein